VTKQDLHSDLLPLSVELRFRRRLFRVGLFSHPVAVKLPTDDRLFDIPLNPTFNPTCQRSSVNLFAKLPFDGVSRCQPNQLVIDTIRSAGLYNQTSSLLLIIYNRLLR
jgi:hypothetical protein